MSKAPSNKMLWSDMDDDDDRKSSAPSSSPFAVAASSSSTATPASSSSASEPADQGWSQVQTKKPSKMNQILSTTGSASGSASAPSASTPAPSMSMSVAARATRRLMHDMQEMQRNPVPDCMAQPLDEDIFTWHCQGLFSCILHMYP